jgi:hypothetical protein
MALGIDYRELLPKHPDMKAFHRSIGEDSNMQERMIEIRRKRRVIQLAVKISQDRLNGFMGGRNRSAKQLKDKIV